MQVSDVIDVISRSGPVRTVEILVRFVPVRAKDFYPSLLENVAELFEVFSHFFDVPRRIGTSDDASSSVEQALISRWKFKRRSEVIDRSEDDFSEPTPLVMRVELHLVTPIELRVCSPRTCSDLSGVARSISTEATIPTTSR
jgi:hypothetical protein